MNIFSYIPIILGTLLKFLYDIIGNYGLSIIVFTIITRLLLLPLSLAQTKSMKEMQVIQPKMDEIKKKYANDQEKQQQKIMELYKEHKVNPFAGCLPLLIQLPIIVGLFNVLRQPVKYVFGTEAAYKAADAAFLWMKSLDKPDVIVVAGITLPFILPILSGLMTYVQTAMMSPKTKSKESNSMQMTMLYVFPLLMLYWGLSFPAGVMLYWVVGTIFQIVQQYFTKVRVKEEVAEK